MTHQVFDRVLETTTTTGTGPVTLLGAQTGYQSFGGVMSIGDTTWYALWSVDGSGNPTGVYEEGLGTYTSSNVLTRTTAIVSTNGGALVSLTSGTYYVAMAALASKLMIIDAVNALTMTAVTATPADPASGTMKFYASKVSGKMLPRWTPPADGASSVQPALFGNNVIMYLPNTGATAGINIGAPWIAGGTISHPTPATTSPAVVNQMRRSRFANVVTTTNQVLGVTAMAAGVQQFWRGNAAGLGGFFFFTRFIVELWPAATVRLFAGLSDQTTAVVASDTYAGNLCGIAHITTDAASVLKFVTRDGTTLNSTSITLTQNLQAGQAFDFYMYCKPNDSTIYFRLDDVNAGTTLIDSSTATNLPASTAFLGPQVAMSNGTANVTVTTSAIGINRIYVESNR